MPPSATIRKRRRGLVLVMVLVFLAAISIASIVTFERTNSGTASTSRRVNDQAAVRIAEAGIEKAVWCLNNPSVWDTSDCPGSAYVGETNVSFGNGTFTTTVDVSGGSATINSTGTVQGSGGASSKELQVKLQTTSADVAFSYGLQAGVGGLDMKNGNKIFGNVFSSGPVTGDKSAITGDVVLTKGSPTLDTSAQPTSPFTSLNFGTNASTNDTVAQSFIPTVTDKVYSLEFKLAKHGTPSATVTAYIFSDSSDNPGSDLSGGGEVLTLSTDASSWEDVWTSQVFTPSTNPLLAAGTKYWLVIQTSGVNGSNYFKTVVSPTDATYADGAARLDGATTTMPAMCASPGCDIAFRVNMGGVSGILKVPCSGSLCIDGPSGYGIGGNAYAEIIESTDIKQHACYQTLIGTVKTNSGGETCSGVSTGEVECTNANTKAGVPSSGSYCHPGNTTLDPVDFPLTSFQIAQMEAQAANGGTPGGVDCSGGCTISSGSIGPEKYNGNVTIDGNVTLTGTIWVKGKLTMTSTITLSNAYGTDSGTIIADNPDDPVNSGRIIVGNGGNAVGNTNPDTYIMLLSMSTTTSDTDGAIDVSNNLTAGVVFGANGSVVLKNSADLKEVTGQRIVLQNGSTVTYETGLASVVFSSGPGGSWIYQRGTYQIIN